MYRRWLVTLAVAAALCFNNWLLGLIINPNLIFKDGAVSELSALGQPRELLFRSLDVVAGALFVILAIAMHKAAPKGRGFNWLLFGTVALGVANAFDSLQPLACSETLSKTCVIPVQVSLRHFAIPAHGYSSIVIAISYLVLPIGGWLYATHFRLKWFKWFSIALVALATIYLVATVTQYAVSGTFSDKAKGLTQESQMLLLGSWFVVWAKSIFRNSESA